MSSEVALLARAMLVIHAARVDQGERRPDRRSAARLERVPLLHHWGNRVLCGVGCLMERAGRRLQEVAVPRPMPLGGNASQG